MTNPGLPRKRPEISVNGTEESFSLPDLSGVELPQLEQDDTAILQVEQVTSKDSHGNLRTKTNIKRSVKKGLSTLQKWSLAGAALVVTSILGTVITVWAEPLIQALSPSAPANEAAALQLEPTQQGQYSVAGWAPPLVYSDAPVGSLENHGIRIDTYLLAVEPALADSTLTDDAGEPVFKEGDPIGYFSFVYTNVSDEVIYVSKASLGASPSLSSPQLNAALIPQDSNAEFERELGVADSDGFYVTVQPQYADDVLAWNPGESFAYYRNFPVSGVETLSLLAPFYSLLDDRSGAMDLNADSVFIEGDMPYEFGVEPKLFTPS